LRPVGLGLGRHWAWGIIRTTTGKLIAFSSLLGVMTADVEANLLRKMSAAGLLHVGLP